MREGPQDIPWPAKSLPDRASASVGERHTEAVTIKRIVAIGASSGGIEALTTIAAGLPEDFPAALCVVLHTSPDSPGTLDRILARGGRLPATTAESGMRMREGHIYVAPPDHHLLIEPGVLTLSKGARENRFRPAIDPLFRSAAQVYGAATIGVVLTGGLDDGSAGLRVVKQLGGIAVVQDPDDALFPSMPRSALHHVAVDFVVPVRDMAALLSRLVAMPVTGEATSPQEDLEVEVRIARGENAVRAGVEQIGEPSLFACPECHGVLLGLKDSRPARFRCHTGHAYTMTTLVAAMNEAIEDGLWTSVRVLEEAALVMRHIAAHQDGVGGELGDADCSAQAEDAHRQSEVIRGVVQARQALRVGAE